MPAPDRKRVCVIVPCFNEAQRLDVAAFRSYLRQSPDLRILFVNDGSSDNTSEVLAGLRIALEDRADVLNSPANHGKAEAVRHGINHALVHYNQDAVGFWDADLATPLDAIEQFLTVLDQRQNIEMIFGARVQLLGRRVERRALRHYLGRVFATTVSAMLGMPIYDTQCGAKLFRVTPYTYEVFRDPFLSKWVFDVEIIARYLNLLNRDPVSLGRLIYEYPLDSWVDVAGSKVRPHHFLTAFVDVLRIKLKYLS